MERGAKRRAREALGRSRAASRAGRRSGAAVRHKRDRERFLRGDAEGSADAQTGARREFGEVLSSVVEHSEAGPNDEVLLGTPRNAEPRRKSPLAGGQSGVAHPLRAEGTVVSGNDDADAQSVAHIIESVGRQIVAEVLRVEVRQEPVGLIERPVPVPAQTVRNAEMRRDLELVLGEETRLSRTEMAVCFTVEEFSGALVRIQGARQEIRRVVEIEDGRIVLAILHVQLRVIVGKAECQRVLSTNPGVLRRTLKLVLKDTRIRKVRRRSEGHLMPVQRSDGRGGRIRIRLGGWSLLKLGSHIHVENLEPGEKLSGRKGQANRRWRELLAGRCVCNLPNKSESLLPRGVGRDDGGVVE